MVEDDTETLITLVTSLLSSPAGHTQTEILETLVQCSGDVQAAADRLNKASSPRTRTITGPSRDRKRKSNLDSWLKPTAGESSDYDTIAQDGDRPTQRIRLNAKPASTASSKPVADLMAILRQPPPTDKKRVPKLAPLTLSTPALVAAHTPCTLHYSVLPPELACELFYAMVDASRGWKRNKWWLFDRIVESPHLTSFFARKTNGLDNDESWQEAAQFWYNGRKTDPPEKFPEPMERACQIVEKIVNEELAKRKRFKLEWGDTDASAPPVWRANVAASNCYEGSKESVGWHSDQLTYLGPYPTIASLSLGTKRDFSLREVIPTSEAETRTARTFNIPLPHNSLTIMHASCQEKFKHSIPPQSSIDVYRPAYPRTHGTQYHAADPNPGQKLDAAAEGVACASGASPSATSVTIEPFNCRINITFRFYRPDFRSESIPKCKCGIPTILRPDMKSARVDGESDRYWWTCYAGAQNDGKGCNFWKVMDMKTEGRGPCIGDMQM